MKKGVMCVQEPEQWYEIKSKRVKKLESESIS